MPYYRSDGGAAALQFARQLTGKPYIFGGTWPESGGTDCSGLTQWSYAQVGVNLPRTTYGQYLIARIPNGAALKVGDLLFIAGSDPGPNGEPGHVMIYVSPGQVFQAPFTGEDIGQYAYDTSVYEFVTRPANLLPPPPPPAIPSRPSGSPPVLKVWDTKPVDWIEYLHYKLRMRAPYTGRYGILTWRAVRKFKKAHHLAANSIVGAKTWTALETEK